jgi:hypothetical protein
VHRHAGDIKAFILETLDFSPLSEFSVGTGLPFMLTGNREGNRRFCSTCVEKKVPVRYAARDYHARQRNRRLTRRFTNEPEAEMCAAVTQFARPGWASTTAIPSRSRGGFS